MFGIKINNYLENEMSIDLSHFCKEINKFPDDKSLIIKYLEILVDADLPHKCFDIGTKEFYLNEEYFKKQWNDFWIENKISSDKDNYYIFDTLRHSFSSFKFGGLIQLYERAEKEEWYPKIIINKFIGKDDDIDLLHSDVTIYRGTSFEEYQEGNFSQSWSLRQDIAKGFAFNHYRRQQLYSGTKRVVLQTKISKKSIYYYDKNNNEQEVIVKSSDVQKDNVFIIDEGIQE